MAMGCPWKLPSILWLIPQTVSVYNRPSLIIISVEFHFNIFWIWQNSMTFVDRFVEYTMQETGPRALAAHESYRETALLINEFHKSLCDKIMETLQEMPVHGNAQLHCKFG